VQSLAMQAGDRIAISGLDATAAEVFSTWSTGRSCRTRARSGSSARPRASSGARATGLASLDRFGIVSARAVLLEGSTMLQNLALPFSLEIDELPDHVTARVRGAAGEVGIGSDWLPRRAAEAPPEVRMRAHLARALAVEPAVLLMEHPTAALPRDTVAAFARDVRDVVARRGLTVLAVTRTRRSRTWSHSAPTACRAGRACSRTRAAGDGSSEGKATGDEAAPSAMRAVPRCNECERGWPAYFFISTPHAIRGPPLTPDFGSPVIPGPGSHGR